MSKNYLILAKLNIIIPISVFFKYLPLKKISQTVLELLYLPKNKMLSIAPFISSCLKDSNIIITKEIRRGASQVQ